MYTPLTFLETAHLSVLTRDYFSRKQKELYQQKGTFYKQASIPSNALLASYKVGLPHRIVKYKESHTIAKELIPSNAVDMVNLMIGESAELSALALMKSKYRLKISVEKKLSV